MCDEHVIDIKWVAVAYLHGDFKLFGEKKVPTQADTLFPSSLLTRPNTTVSSSEHLFIPPNNAFREFQSK